MRLPRTPHILEPPRTSAMAELGARKNILRRQRRVRLLSLPRELFNKVFDVVENLSDIAALRLTCVDLGCGRHTALYCTYQLLPTHQSIARLQRMLDSPTIDIRRGIGCPKPGWIKHLIIEGAEPCAEQAVESWRLYHLLRDALPTYHGFYVAEWAPMVESNMETILSFLVIRLDNLNVLGYSSSLHGSRGYVQPSVEIRGQVVRAAFDKSPNLQQFSDMMFREKEHKFAVAW
ncbi:hypothetical protein BKA58DRAFT_467980 [Alternaria rosae]|uniref:uncharacterized protein n=1 Tax=Alternaria rosae TaxID=1187941 RepID=UPI001E8D33E2|nr:uncharacterized protein BKA58DRAFT_467980 [Alternaria rosae]KAH6872153.1 hypothetical protein BKA58DRAFT_467980 [Alternaria rosae]